MKYILSAAILALASISPVVNALPGAYSTEYAETPAVASIPSVKFACGYEEENVRIICMYGKSFFLLTMFTFFLIKNSGLSNLVLVITL